MLIALWSVAACADPGAGAWRHEELRRYEAREAHQGVAVDARHFYAIANRAIGKYRKDNGERVGAWSGAPGGRIQHLNGGIVVDGKLYCAHSNFPDWPARSSVEIWDTSTMQHIGAHLFDEPAGSLTWLVPHAGGWLACFAHYDRTSDAALTRLVELDALWQPLASWAFPVHLIDRFAGYSSSGGALGPDGQLFVTGHAAAELYALARPRRGAQLEWTATIPISAAGQAFAWDAAEAGVLYSIRRDAQEVVVSRIWEARVTPPPRS